MPLIDFSSKDSWIESFFVPRQTVNNEVIVTDFNLRKPGHCVGVCSASNLNSNTNPGRLRNSGIAVSRVDDNAISYGDFIEQIRVKIYLQTNSNNMEGYVILFMKS